jgi:hypothetical protein
MMDIDILCFKIKNEIICVNKFAYNYINLSKKQCKCLLTAEEYRKTLEKLYENGEELPIVEIEKHRYEPRVYYIIYTITISINRYRYFMEIFDGTSATYEYCFCRSKRKCREIMQQREQGNKMLY